MKPSPLYKCGGCGAVVCREDVGRCCGKVSMVTPARGKDKAKVCALHRACDGCGQLVYKDRYSGEEYVLDPGYPGRLAHACAGGGEELSKGVEHGKRGESETGVPGVRGHGPAGDRGERQGPRT